MIDILMPRLSDTMAEGTVATWHKQPGDAVSPGDVLVDIETDKAVMEHEAYEAGTLAVILVAEGDSAPIGAAIARLDDGSGRDAAPARPPGDEAAEVAAPVPTAVLTPAPTPEPTQVRPDRRFATPLVRRLARERGVDLDTVVGTGPGGRIVRADLEAFTDGAGPARAGVSASPSATSTDADVGADARAPRPVPFDAVRQAIAARLTTSGTTIPTFTVTASADVGELLALRARINQAHEGIGTTGTAVSINDFLVRAVALALRAHPGMNASYSPEGRGQTLVHQRIHVGIAVAAPSGLVVPVVRDADRIALTAVAAATRELVGKAADRKLTAAEMSDATFSISNLGMYGVEHFTAILNPPEGAILAIGGVRDELTMAEGTPVARKRMRYTVTADHRIIDGALAAQFLATLTGLLEEPLRVVA